MVQNFKLMVWRALALRKQRWFLLYMEVSGPIVLLAMFMYLASLMPEGSRELVYEKSPLKYNKIVSKHFIDAANIAYTPYNSVTDIIMSDVSKKLTANNITVSMVYRDTEEKVNKWLQDKYLVEVYNSSEADPSFTPGFGVIFHSAGNASSLWYTLRPTFDNLLTSEDTLYGEEQLRGFEKYYNSGFTTIQALIDQAYLSYFYQIDTSGNIYVEELVSNKFTTKEFETLVLPFYVMSGFIGLIMSTIEGVVEEKASGMKELMKIMGLSSLVWLNWFIYLWIVVAPVTVIVTYLITMDPDPFVNADFFVVLGFILLFLLSVTTFIFFFSTFFTDGSLALVICILVWHMATLSVSLLISRYPDKYSLWVHVLTCLWPSIPFLWILTTITNFQKNGITWTLAENLFDDGAGGGRISVGICLIMMCVNTVIYSILTWYCNQVNPGPYGKPKPFSFIFQCFKKNNYYESKSADSRKLPKSYEPPPQGLNVGIRIENLRKTFNEEKVVAVDNVNLDIYEGNITVLLGHNGAGKTTTMSMLTGLTTPSHGKIIIDEKNIFDNMTDFRKSLGLCLQQNLVFPFFSAFDHLKYFGILKGLTWDQAEEEGLKLLTTLNMEEKKGEMVAKLSGGMKRKLCLCIALIGNPKVLILDEPTSGLDPESRRQVWDMLLGLRGQRTILITTHFMDEAEVLGDMIAIMDHGNVSCYGSSMFLKKLYGAGYQLSVTKQEVVPVAPITYIVNQHVSGATAKIVSDSQITYNIKAEESVCFPELFADLEHKSRVLGVTGTTISCTTMEDVFLKVVEKRPELSRGEDAMGNVEIEIFAFKVFKTVADPANYEILSVIRFSSARIVKPAEIHHQMKKCCKNAS